ncbi:hypothetical protein S58_70670 [Bradyrhizobium oligotrophicum S58]|uniref:Uncharacterized protein n=1 Tax=Bradyrhizobium oligotrophicum S58 TaxID=1245469 RepID=M4ZGR6_9BRAD|nr:hypothetical protein S58_70670 [Bradyrhizobium oligotrophicum S58]
MNLSRYGKPASDLVPPACPKPLPVVMGPCVRRDDTGYEATGGAKSKASYTICSATIM